MLNKEKLKKKKKHLIPLNISLCFWSIFDIAVVIVLEGLGEGVIQKKTVG